MLPQLEPHVTEELLPQFLGGKAPNPVGCSAALVPEAPGADNDGGKGRARSSGDAPAAAAPAPRTLLVKPKSIVLDKDESELPCGWPRAEES